MKMIETPDHAQLIYLACPYQHRDPQIMIERFEAINKIAALLIQRGYYIFSPISHTHPIAIAAKLPQGWEYWNSYDRLMLWRCDRLLVAKLPGWDQSIGVLAEIGIAKEFNKPIEYWEINQ